MKNRLVAVPIYTGYALPDGKVSSLLIEHYSQLAKSGVAMVVVANAAVAFDGMASTYNLRADRDDFLPGLAKLAEAIRREGALACLQLNHAGRFAKTERPLLPSPIDSTNLAFNVASLKSFMEFFPLEKRFGLTRYFMRKLSTWGHSMTGEDRERIIRSFGDAAYRAYDSGFEMIELHGANGYLLTQFLSSFTNGKPSGHGGDFHARITFPLAVLREVKGRLPADFAVGFRLTLREWVPGGIDMEEALVWARILQQTGIAYLSPAVGTYNSIFSSASIKRLSRQAYLKRDVALLSNTVKVPIIISGRVSNPSLANKLLKEEVADLIGLGRPIRTDFDWMKKAWNGNDRIRTCINCNWCLKSVILEQGFVCRRWPTLLQQRIAFQHKLLSRHYNTLWVVTNADDLRLFTNIFPLFSPQSNGNAHTILFLKGDEKDNLFDFPHDISKEWSEQWLNDLELRDSGVNIVNRVAREPFDDEVRTEIESARYGVIIMGQNWSQGWRERIVYKEREKVIALIGSTGRHSEILVPVDLSDTTLLILTFLRQIRIDRPGRNICFVHVLTSPSKTARQRWKDMVEIAGFGERFHLKLIPSRGNITAELLSTVKSGNFGTIIMGKRGLSGIKRWILGSVSRGVLRGLTDQSVFLVD